MSSYSWQGASGRWYEFDVARAARAWDAVGGLYMFVKPHDATQDWGGPISLFAARTDNFAQTLARHDMWQAAENLGAKEIHLLVVRDHERRAEIERDILEAQAPILNRSLRRVA